MDTTQYVGELFKLIYKGLEFFVDFIMNLPSLIYNFLSLIPDPLMTVLNSFVGFLILIIFLKVVRLIVG